jgi:hypothetical protein
LLCLALLLPPLLPLLVLLIVVLMLLPTTMMMLVVVMMMSMMGGDGRAGAGADVRASRNIAAVELHGRSRRVWGRSVRESGERDGVMVCAMQGYSRGYLAGTR